MTPLMKCGHSANAVETNTREPACAICGTLELANETPKLEGRKAKCSYYPHGGKYGACSEPVPSSTELAFFKHAPGAEFDSYYCGCWGWD